MPTEAGRGAANFRGDNKRYLTTNIVGVAKTNGDRVWPGSLIQVSNHQIL